MAISQTSMLDSAQRTAAALYERYGRFAPGIATVLLAVLLGQALAGLVWTLVPVPEAARWQAPPPPPASSHAGDSIDLNAITSAALFGRYTAPSAETTLLAAPETPLNLTLIGVWADDREDHSRALIAATGGEEKSYAIGDDVSRGVTLNAIFPDRVILSRGGRLETLRLERGDGSTSAGGTDSPPQQVAASAPSGAPQFSRIRDEVTKDPARAAEYIRVQPANVGGALKGYRVYPGRDRTAFTAAGLRPGDLVTSLNGVQLDEPLKALQLLGDLGQTGQLNLTVERGGQSQNLSINLSQ